MAPDASLNEKDRLLAAEDTALSGGLRRVVDFYERNLRFALERPRWIALFAGVLVVISFFCYRALGTDLLPEMDEGGFVLDYITPDHVHVFVDGRIVKSGGAELAKELEADGYDPFIPEKATAGAEA